MARHPNVITRINYVVEFIADVCDAPFSVYVETFFPAFLKLLISYFALDIIQIVTGFTRPVKALARSRRGPHGIGRKNRGKPKTYLSKWKRWLSYDPWDHIGRTLGNLTDLPTREVTGGVLHFWYFYDVIQRIAYWWMIVDLTTEFFYDWFSAVNQSFYCQRQRNAWLMAHGDDQVRTGLLPVWPTNCQYIDKIRGPITWNIFGGSYAGESASFGFSAGLVPIPPIPATEMWLIVENTVTGEQHIGNPDPLHPDEPVSVAFKIQPGILYAIATHGDGDYMVLAPHVFMVGLDSIP